MARNNLIDLSIDLIRGTTWLVFVQRRCYCFQ